MDSAVLDHLGRSGVSRRGFLAGLGALGGAALLGGCATSASSGPVSQTAGAVTIQSNLSSPQAKVAIEALAKAFAAQGKDTATVNTIASETFRTQLPSYLTANNPPDVYTWYPGSLLSGYARKGLLLDVSEVWQGMSNYSSAFRSLSGDGAGHQIFVPTDYYWWGFFYRKSNFAKWGLTEPKTWSDFLALCEALRGKGVAPSRSRHRPLTHTRPPPPTRARPPTTTAARTPPRTWAGTPTTAPAPPPKRTSSRWRTS